MNTRNARRTALAWATVIFIFGCATVPTDIPEDLTAPELFQRAQEAIDQSNFRAADVYYQTALDRFGDSPDVAVVAEYELGFLRYRQGDLEGARPYFEAVLRRYEGSSQAQAQLPPWPPVLSQRFLDRIEAGEGPDFDPPPGGSEPPSAAPGASPDLP
ncbi:MAG: hypothetical protein EA383_06560 [Spirochaetaceae bacterium]|nr:MAG: hypothetical protein EA383_06560 [Spirochaetaceae bacterium]